MTKLIIDLADALDEFHPDDRVVVWSPVHREGSRGQVVNTRKRKIPLANGQATAEVEPGPLMVQIQCQGMSDTQPKETVVPEDGPVTLVALFEEDFGYTPAVVGVVERARNEAVEAANRVGSAEQVGDWAERAETAADDALTIKNSIPSTVQSEVDTRVPPKVAEVISQDQTVADAAAAAVGPAVDEAIGTRLDGKSDVGHTHGSAGISEKTVSIGNPADAYKMLHLDINGRLRVDTNSVTVGRDVANREFVLQKAWGQGLVPTSVTSLDQLIDGMHSVANAGVAGNFGIPGRATGTLSIQTIANGRTAWYLTGGTSPTLYICARDGGVWSAWEPLNGQQNTGGGDSWYKGLVATDKADLDLLDDGMWGIGNGGVSRTLGIPGAPYGNLQIQTIATGRTAFVLTQDEVPALYVTAKSGGVWAEWQKIFPTNISEGSKFASPGLKTVPLALTTGISGDGVTSGRWRMLAHFGAPITRWRLRISNYAPQWGTDRGGFTVGQVSVGTHDGDGQMAQTRIINDTPAEVPDDGEWVSPWVSGVDLQQEHLIDWEFSGATSTYLSLGTGWDMTTGVPVFSNRMALWVWIEAETYGQTPVVALIGDSTGAGVGADRPVHESPLAIVGRQRGFLPVLYAHSGDTLEGNPDITDFNFARWQGMAAPDSIIIQAGSNDMHAGGADLEEMQRRYKATAEAARQISPVLIGATVKPRFPNHPDYDGNRIAFNQWLQTQPEGIRDVLQFDAVLAPDGSLPAEYNADGSHINSAGYLKMAEAFNGIPVSRPAVVTDVGADEVDTGWRIIPLLAGTGTARIKRTGTQVTVAIEDWLHEGQYATHVALLPAGFRPKGKRYFIAADHTWASAPSIFGMYSGSYVSWLRRMDGNSTRPSTPQSGEVQFSTDDPAPAIYPGDPS